MKNHWFLYILILFSVSCTDPQDPKIEPENFEKVEGNSHINDSKIFGLQVEGDRLYLLSELVPGYIDASGNIVATCCFLGGLSLNFEPSFSDDYMVRPIETLNGFIFFPKRGFGNPLIMNLEDAIGAAVNGGRIFADSKSTAFIMNRNFALNGNTLIFNILIDGELKIAMSDLEFDEGFNLVRAVNYKIFEPVSFGLDPQTKDLMIRSIQNTGNQWIAHITANSEDISSGKTYLIGKDSNIIGMDSPTEGDPEFRFFDYTVDQSGGFLISESHVGRISYSANSSFNNPKFITELNAPLKISALSDKAVYFVPGAGQMTAITNYLNPTSNNVLTFELDRTGLEANAIYSIKFFQGKAYIATDNGIFSKSLDNFWEEVRTN
ncbi:hypothetical protein [Aquiflexum sp.]|uniref:hypothetical protein n=1 Tax=Aquiflexum sp. TaxID=1872584 RepID=UPI003593AC63